MVVGGCSRFETGIRQQAMIDSRKYIIIDYSSYDAIKAGSMKSYS